MSDQSDALNKKAVEAGIVGQPPAFPPKEVDDGEIERNALPWVQLPVDGRQAWAFADEIGSVVSQPRQGGPPIYRYKDGLATVEWNAAKGRYEIEMMEAHDFRTWVEHFCTPFKLAFNKHGATKVKQTMGVDDAKTCLRSRDFCLKQPQLLRVNPVRLPVMRPDGTIELLPSGYDPQSCILTLPPAWEYDETMDVAAGVAFMSDLLREFPFEDERSRVVAITMFVANYGYFLQSSGAARLGYLLNAKSSGSGKSLLVELALTVPWLWASIDAMPETGKEMKDRLDTAVREAKPYVAFDDLPMSFVRSNILNAFMTAVTWGGRKFHAQEEFNEAKTPVIFLTGNNIETTPDIARRTLMCALFAPEADINARVIERPIDAEWLRRPVVHQQICSALWAIIRHWRDNGRPHAGRMVPGYERWSKIFGGMIVAAGLGDPCEPSQVEGKGDTEFQDMMALVTKLAEGVEKVIEYEFSDIVQVCRELSCFEHIIDGKLVKHKDGDVETYEFELTNKANSTFGKRVLGKFGGQVFTLKDGRRVLFGNRGKNRHKRYTLEVVGRAKLSA